MSKHQRAEEDEKRAEKRAHTDPGEPLYDANGQAYWEVRKLRKQARPDAADTRKLGGPARRLSISKWRGQVLVDLREYYEETATGQMKPGKKGMSLTQKQFEYLMTISPQVGAFLQNMDKDASNEGGRKIHKSM